MKCAFLPEKYSIQDTQFEHCNFFFIKLATTFVQMFVWLSITSTWNINAMEWYV